MALQTRGRLLSTATTGINTQRLVPDQPAGLERSPACTCSGTRRSSAATPSPTKRASTRTACSRSARPTRSCGPRTSAFAKTDLVLGKHSGRAALADRAKALGYHLTGEQLQTVFDEFKKLADKKKEVYDGDIVALIEQQIHGEPTRAMEARGVRSRQRQRPQAAGQADTPPRRKGSHRRSRRRRRPDRRRVSGHRKNHRHQAPLHRLPRESATLGHDAQGEVNLSVEHGNQTFRGRGVSTDTVEATVQAILSAVNRIVLTAGGRETGIGSRGSHVRAAGA